MDDCSPRSWSEPERISELQAYGILDTPREADFDELARMAADLCEVPIALVSLVGTDRQFFKAAVGFGERGTPIETSFCAHAILQDEVMIVPDATLDPRFARNPLVTGETHLRFYAGALLRTPSGVPLGTLCVLDRRPRTLDERQVRHLGILARQVMTQIELRRVLADQNRALQTAQAAERRGGEIAREMAHRMKNTLAVVQAIVSQTFQHAATMDDSRAAITARLAALARSQDILTTADGAVARLGDVVEAALAPHRTGQGRFLVSGPEVDLPGPQVLGLTLAVHELASNAAKYGALSGETGTASVGWSVGADGRLTIEWREEGGPPVAPPTRTGFGSRLLRNVVAGYFDGESTLDLAPDGVRFRLVGWLDRGDVMA